MEIAKCQSSIKLDQNKNKCHLEVFSNHHYAKLQIPLDKDNHHDDIKTLLLSIVINEGIKVVLQYQGNQLRDLELG